MTERNGRFFNVSDLVDAAIADDPNTLQQALTMMNPKEAAAFYREECVKHSVGPVQSFCRQLNGNAAFIDFSNNYFGERGITPVMATIQRLPIVEVRFRKCDLSSDDIARIQTSLMAHATLTSIDLRGNLISLPSARKLLSLVIQNRRLTALSVDDNAPKSILIQRQCLANANVAVHASACVMCQKSMVHSVTGNVESKIFCALEERLAGRGHFLLSIAEVETIHRCILACTDVNDGVLFLCSIDCINALAGDIAEAMRMVVNEMVRNMQRQHHRHPVIARCVVELIEHYKQEGAPPQLFVLPEKKPGDPKESDWVECSVCGHSCIPISDSAAQSVIILCRDIKRGAVMRPSALLRVIHTMLRYVRLQYCGKKCVRHIVRYGVTGYGGVIRSHPDPGVPMLSSVDVPLDYLPNDDFCVINFAEVQVLDHGEEDTTCAVTIASMMSDIDTIPIDPYIIYAVGRYLSKRSPGVFGMELRHACEAVRVVGCLAADQAPFHRKNRPARSAYVDWLKWPAVCDVEKLQRLAFARRRQAYYLIDGPSDNAFDRIRTALWAFREQQRCAVVVIKFCLAWIREEKGIIPSDMPPRGGFYTTVKVLGQTQILNSNYLLLQPNFGCTVGNRGFFYIPRSIFNRSIRGAAYMFIDTTAIRENQGIQPKQHHLAMVSKHVLRVLERPSLMFDVISFLGNAASFLKQQSVPPSQLRMLRDSILSTMPPSVFFAFIAPGMQVPHQFHVLRQALTRLFESSRGHTQLAFMWNEVLGDAAARWVVQASDQLLSARRENHVDSNESSLVVSRRQTVVDREESIAWGSVPVRQRAARGTPDITKQHPFTPTPPLPRTPAAPPGLPQKDGVDPAVEQIEGSLKNQREELKLLRSHNKRRSASSWDPALLGHRQSTNAVSGVEEAMNFIPLDILGSRWAALSVQDDLGQHTSEALFFVKNYYCRYDSEARTVTKALSKAGSDPLYERFPFANGFDCTFRITVHKKSESYFFSEQTWMLWDVSRHICITGPHTTAVHRTFRALPPEFHQHLDGAIELPGRPVVLLFSQFRYVAYDVDACAVLQSTMLVSDPMGPFFKLAALFPSGPMAVFCGSGRKGRQIAVGYDGRVVHVALDSTGNFEVVKDNAGRESFPICSSLLAGLPLVFQQNTTLAAPSIVQTLLESAPRNKLVDLKLFSPLHAPQPEEALIEHEDAALRRFAKSWDVTISTSFELVTGADLMALTRPFNDDEVASPVLLQDSAVLRHVNQSQEGMQHTVDFNVGSVNASAFAYVQILLDTASVDARVLQVAPLEISVEYSNDGVCFNEVSVIVASSAAASAYWGVVHSAHFWRLRFLNSVPLGVGVVKILWYTAQWVVDASPYELTEMFAPSASATVRVEGNMLLRPASELLVDIAPQPVLCVPQDDLWFARHAILPLLPDGDSCLFFCGDTFVEYDFLDEHVVSNRCIALSHHPAFKRLPFPFYHGFDAIFYPNVREPSKVILLHDEKLILWDIYEGAPASPVENFADSTYFKGMPFPVKRLHDVINVWDYPGHVFIFSDAKVVRWNVLDRTIVEGPYTREQIPVFDVPAFADQPFLAVTSLPGELKTFFIFCGTEVVESTIQRDHKIAMKPPSEFTTTDFFNTISRYLNWGVQREKTVMTFDFMDKFPLVLGLTMRSSDGCNPGTRWDVEFSDDGIAWTACAQHLQAVPRSSSSWHLKDVCGVSHQFWRLSTVAGSTSVASVSAIIYSQVLFHVLPSSVLSVVPRSVEFSGEVRGTPASLLTSSLMLLPRALPVAVAAQEDELLIDFGTSPIELTGFSYETAASHDDCQTVAWTVWCSDNGTSWQHVGTWRIASPDASVAWAPTYPQQFWKLVFTAAVSAHGNNELRGFTLYENAAPSVVTNEGSDVRHLVGLLQPRLISDHVIDFKAAIGSTMSIDFKQSPQALVGLALAIDVDSFTFMTSFEVEYSDDATQWCIVGTLVSCDDLGNAAWESEGSHRFWRLRVGRHHGAKTVRIKRVELSVSGPMLYRRHKRHIVEVERNTYSLISEKQIAFVAVTARVPSAAVFAVEKLNPHDEWDAVALLVNKGAAATECSIGWPPTCASSIWRIRYVETTNTVTRPEGMDDELYVEKNETTAEPPVVENVSWSSLSCSVTTPVVLTPAATIVSTGFDSDPLGSEPVDKNGDAQSTVIPTRTPSLHDASIQREVQPQYRGAFDLTSSGLGNIPDAGAAVSWCFHDKSPRFTSVTIRARRIAPPLAGESPSPQLAPVSTQELTSRDTLSPVLSPTPSSDVSHIGIHIEVSNDGILYVPIAYASLKDDHIVALSWADVVSSPYWRLRFAGMSSCNILFLSTVEWSFESAAASFPGQDPDVVLSSALHTRYCSSDDVGSALLRAKTIEGIEQVNSVSTGLREPDDIEEFAKLTQPLVLWQKAFQKTMVRAIKEYRGEQQNVPPGRQNSSAAPAGSVDVGVVVDRLSTTHRDARFRKLLMMIGVGNADGTQHRIAVHEFKLTKDSTSWCGPKSEYRGKLSAPLFGFVDLSLSFSVRWQLTKTALCHSSVHLAPSLTTPIHCATSEPMIALEINRTDWFASAAFPQLRILYEFRMTERQLTMVVVTREVQFYPPHVNLIPPGGTALQSKFPFSVFGGINFIATTVKPKDCLSPAMAQLANVFPKSVLDKPCLMVLTVPSLDAHVSQARFTAKVPTEFHFGIPGLTMQTATIEIITDIRKPLAQSRRISFLTDDAFLVSVNGLGDDVRIPLRVAGTVSEYSSCVRIQARSLSGNVECPAGLSQAILCNLRFGVEVLLADAPCEYIPCPVIVSGLLCTSCGLSFPAQMALSDLSAKRGTIKVELNECKFSTLVQLAGFLTSQAHQLPVLPWMHEVPLSVTASLIIYPHKLAAKASGVVSFYGQSGRIGISITSTGVHMSFTLPSLKLGQLAVLGSAETNGLVLIEATAPAGGTPTIRLDGLCKSLSRQPAPAQIELSQGGTLCISSGPFYDVCVRDDSLFPVGAYATVSVSRDSFVKPLSASLRATSMISTLLSHGLPFSFTVHSVSVTNCVLERQAMQLSFRGVLFGYRFDVTATVTSPDNTEQTIADMCDGLASHIMEQCNESLWSSLDTFVGCVHDVPNEIDAEADDENESSSASNPTKKERGPTAGSGVVFTASLQIPGDSPSNSRRGVPHALKRSARARDGTLVAHWLEQEEGLIDAVIASATKKL